MAGPTADVIFFYQRHAAAWAQDRGTRLYETPWLDRFLTLQPASPTILDLGCGSGDPLARALIAGGANLTGVDSSPAMIAMRAQKFPDQSWHIADMRSLSLAQKFAGILAWDSFFHLTPSDQRAMVPRFRQHAAPGGALMFTSGPSQGAAIGTLHGDPLYHASLAPDEYRALLAAHDFSVIAHKTEDPAVEGRTVWLTQRNQI